MGKGRWAHEGMWDSGCATTVAAAFKSRFSKNECVIQFKEGSLKIDYNKNVGDIFMSGPVSKVEKIEVLKYNEIP